MGRRLLARITLIFVTVFFLSGCTGSSLPHLQKFREDRPIQTCNIGILPLLNKTDFNQGNKIIYRALLAKLVEQQTWRLALEGDVVDNYRDLHLRPWTQPTPEQIQIIASRLDVDILIGGEILEMKEPREGNHVNPHIKIQLHVYNGKDGTIQWSTSHERHGWDYRKVMHFGINNTVGQLSNNIIEEILNLWKQEALIQCQN